MKSKLSLCLAKRYGQFAPNVEKRRSKMKKSITRRILALAIALPFVGVAATLAMQGVSEAFIALATIATTVVGFYFGTKANMT